MHIIATMTPLLLPVAAPSALLSATGGDPIAPLVLALAAILAAAKLGGDLAERIGQPAVLGEIVAGIVLGNLDLVGVPWFRVVAADATVDAFARLGAVLLLFEVGLESTVGDMMRVGWRSLIVAVLGVVTPWVLGWGVGALVLPERSRYVHAFLGAALTATSVGITARVFQDLGRSRSPEARIILGAAVIDDVLGLMILAVITSVIAAANLGTELSYAGIALAVGKAVVFLFGGLAVGSAVSPRLFAFAGRLRGRGLLLVTALVFCFLLAYSASAVGLAPIVGAYAAGLVLEDRHGATFTSRGEPPLVDLVRPIGMLLVPVFFVVMGMRVELRSFAHAQVLGLAALLTVAAIIGKQACALGGIGARLDKLTIGLGMIPRGEVGLIFANLGLGLTVQGEQIVDRAIFSAVVIMVVLTTLVTPSALKWSLARAERA
jgi:Kef-type K+ transport system membrane component KefB